MEFFFFFLKIEWMSRTCCYRNEIAPMWIPGFAQCGRNVQKSQLVGNAIDKEWWSYDDMLMFRGDDTEREVLGNSSERCCNGGKENHSCEGGRSCV